MRRSGRISAVVLSAALVVLGVAGPASAAAPGNCPAGYACIWSDPDYKSDGSNGAVIRFEYKIYEMDTFLYYWSILGGFHWGGNNGSSAYNNGNSYATRWYDGEYFTGASYMYLAKGKGVANLTTNGWDDRIESACFTSNCS